RAQVVHQLSGMPMTRRTVAAFWVSTGLAVLLAVAGVGLAATSGAAQRRRTGAVLTTLGATARHTAWPAPAHLLSVVLLAPVVGALVGWALLGLLGSSIDLGPLTGNPSQLHLAPATDQAAVAAVSAAVVAVVALIAVTLMAARYRPQSRFDTPEEQ
ncbi:MAG: FtsX-like permease family protein, partial [Nocardioidaceae bacterium]